MSRSSPLSGPGETKSSPLLGRGGALLAAATALIGLVWANVRATPQQGEKRLAGYTTSLKGRKRAQIRNATLAARALEGKAIGAGKIFSYNAVVSASDQGSDAGYVPAPVSVEGTMVPALGGGVCQTSTTLYNAALLAGLSVVERHPHTIAPKYVPPGRDAAVAWPGVDLRLRNPHAFPVRLRARVVGERLCVEVVAEQGLTKAVTLETQLLSVQEPGRRSVAGRRRSSAGMPGLRVATYRTVGGSRERLSDDTYATLDAVVPD
jgi:vancomycin resistance protein VanW